MEHKLNIYRGQLRKVPLFEVLNDDEFALLLSAARMRELAEGENLFEHKEPARHYYYVVSGEVKLTRASAEGGEKVIEIVRPRTLFAEAVVFMSDSPVYPVSAQAIRASEIIAFDHATILELLHESKNACFRMLGRLSRRLHSLVDEIDRLTLHNGTFRFVLYLLQQIPDAAMEAPEIVLTSPKYVIASRLGVAPETFSRIESRLVKSGQVQVRDNHIVILDIEGLRKIVAL